MIWVIDLILFCILFQAASIDADRNKHQQSVFKGSDAFLYDTIDDQIVCNTSEIQVAERNIEEASTGQYFILEKTTDPMKQETQKH